ncbi:MAG: transcriptional activator NhaR [Deltaproteobacteria bacterium]|nr:transcriptional activator NhaR [Deltaproteobacteria bacterium]
MEWLNYHHLLYFWVVAREGGLTQASKVLRLAHPTLSGQIRQLEESFGEKLFDRSGRRLVLTDVGKTVFGYADEIFSLGNELIDTIRQRPTGRPARVHVGISHVLPKLVARRLLDPALQLAEPVHLVCHEDRYDRLLAALAVHDLDVILTDAPVAPGTNIRAYGHLLGECGITFFVAPSLHASCRGRFPKCLDGAPFLAPADGTSLRRSLEQWFTTQAVSPRIVAEFDDSALLKTFGGDGVGVFAAPSVVDAEVKAHHGVEVLGRTQEVRERFYAISAERKLKNPAVAAICANARSTLFH